MAKPGKFILNKLIRKIAALSSEGQRKSYCRELLCCSGRALCCSGTRLREADGRAPGLAVLGAPSPHGPAAPRGRWVGNFLGHGAATHWGARPLELLGSAERASWQEPGLPFPSFLKLPSAMGLLFSMQGFHQPLRGRGHWEELHRTPRAGGCWVQSAQPKALPRGRLVPALLPGPRCSQQSSWPQGWQLSAPAQGTPPAGLGKGRVCCAGTTTVRAWGWQAGPQGHRGTCFFLPGAAGFNSLFFFWCLVQNTSVICSTLQGCSERLSAVGQIP